MGTLWLRKHQEGGVLCMQSHPMHCGAMCNFLPQLEREIHCSFLGSWCQPHPYRSHVQYNMSNVWCYWQAWYHVL